MTSQSKLPHICTCTFVQECIILGALSAPEKRAVAWIQNSLHPQPTGNRRAVPGQTRDYPVTPIAYGLWTETSLAIGGSEILRDAYVSWRESHFSMGLPLLTGLMAACIISLLVGYTWVVFLC